MSHNFALASHAPDTKVRVSGANDRDITSPVCPMNEVHCWPVSMSHRALNQNNPSLLVRVTSCPGFCFQDHAQRDRDLEQGADGNEELQTFEYFY
jgi:hypothetical protein